MTRPAAGRHALKLARVRAWQPGIPDTRGHGTAKRKPEAGEAATPDPAGTAAQEKAIDLADAFHDADRGGLERLDADGRAEQERLRTAFYLYVDALWDHVKARARAEAGDLEYDTARDPAYSGVAGMRDLAAELVAAVHEVQVSAGEETGL